MSSYIPVPIETEPVDLAAEAFDYLEGKVPGWQPYDGQLETWLIQALAQIAAELRTLIALVPPSIFEYYGATVLGLPPYAAIQATAMTTWTMVDGAGYTVHAGTVIALTPPASQDAFTFSLVDELVIPAGQTVAAAVETRALEAGVAASGLTGAIEVIDPLVFVSGVTLDSPTSGGQDAETTEAYLSRLSALLSLLTPRPILPRDFAILAQREVAGVARAVAIDLYNPGPPVDTNCPRCVTVVCVDTDGQPCSPSVKQEVDDLLQAAREVNFLVFVADPTYTTIDVSYEAYCYPGYDATDVQTRVDAALANWLSPGSWGVPKFGDPGTVAWINDTSVRYLEVSQVINDVDGVHYVVEGTLLIGVHGGTMGTANVDMSGVAPLPNAGTISGVVHQGV